MDGHVQAAQMVIGLQLDNDRKRHLNLTSLRRNKRKKLDKTTGHKWPCLGNIDVMPANDIDPAELRHLEDIALASLSTAPAS
jgi:hypothetical protein